MHATIRRITWPLAGLLLLLTNAIHSSPANRDDELEIDGDVPNARTIGTADLTTLKSYSAEIRNADGTVAKYEGPRLVDVLMLSGVKFGETLRGERMASYLLATSRDNYRVVIALPELDPAFTDKLILVATLKDGKPLSQSEGPLRLILPDDKRQTRWAKQLRSLTIVKAAARQ